MHNRAEPARLVWPHLRAGSGVQAPTPRRAEILVALLNAAVLLLIGRDETPCALFRPEAVLLIAALIALAANLASAGLLKGHGRENIDVRSAFLHLVQYALASRIVVAAAVSTGTRPLGRMSIPSRRFWSGSSFCALLESTPAGLHVGALAQAVSERFPSVGQHHIRVWELGPGPMRPHDPNENWRDEHRGS
jgi:hypothetical protein